MLAGYDHRDAMSRDVAVPDYTAGWEKAVRGRRFVLCPDFYAGAEIDSEVNHAFEEAMQVFRSLGAQVDSVPFRDAKRLSELFRAIAGPEFAEFHRPFFEKNPEGYGTSVRERLDWSFEVTSDEYVRALRERELLRREVANSSNARRCIAASVDAVRGRADCDTPRKRQRQGATLHVDTSPFPESA